MALYKCCIIIIIIIIIGKYVRKRLLTGSHGLSANNSRSGWYAKSFKSFKSSVYVVGAVSETIKFYQARSVESTTR